MNEAAAPRPAGDIPRPAAVRWIVSPRYDLFFFVFSAGATLLFFALYRVAHRLDFVLGGDSILITYLLFTALFDHPHIFQTFSRTHGDPAEFARRKGMYTYGLGVFLAAGFAVAWYGKEAELIVFAAVFGTWHIARQHWGFLKIYKYLNKDFDPVDAWLDGSVFAVGMLACFFNDYADLRGPIEIYRDLRVAFPSLPPDLGSHLWTLFLVLLTGLGFRQTWRVMEGKPVVWPKLFLLASALSTHYFVFFATATPFLVAEALETVYHDIQYQGWVMRYQRVRFPDAARLVGKWAAASLAYGLVVGAVEVWGLARGGRAMWLFVPFTMIVLYHYWVDGYCWRVREAPELKEVLG